MGALYASDAAQTHAGERTLIALIYIFIAAFISTWAMVIRVVASEMQPRRTRAAATSLAQCFGWVCYVLYILPAILTIFFLSFFFQAVNWIIAFSTPLFLTRSTSGPYLLFGACSLLTVLVCIVFQPETKGLSLDMLDQEFQDTKLQSAVKRYFGSKSSGHSTAIELPNM
jgi:hypothetical protein